MNAVSIPGSEELEVLSPSCIEIVQEESEKDAPPPAEPELPPEDVYRIEKKQFWGGLQPHSTSSPDSPLNTTIIVPPGELRACLLIRQLLILDPRGAPRLSWTVEQQYGNKSHQPIIVRRETSITPDFHQLVGRFAGEGALVL
ncbi:hypothetical protein AVEN_65167-1 [Araneus ventricosus]|uniref:Uncharacterized protein n=1 Tax=Araneus ventricosus TaxID=182803 RepID=A0A4Y2AH66_ARAVE|nr:hypothetical protein AVEN_65167-1 [Araneus ventricosus]